MHNAAWMAVDKAERMKDRVYVVYSLVPKYIAEARKEIGAKMMFISTDYVFDGKGTSSLRTTDKRNRFSVYGSTKAAGENFVVSALNDYWIIKISWFFDINGHNFIMTIIKLVDMGKTELNIVDDQIGFPT
jgi:dTDP-4-dehydrorhamnose reductase